ncbi:MAG: biotin transporter BioY [Oscillibacter sp.]|nr:biotin transporter BioY [Oscillibacter sp.]
MEESRIRDMCLVGVMAAVTCVLAPLSIPIGPVPVTLTNLAVYLSLYLLGMRRSVLSYLVYLLLGVAGLPVFSGFSGGLGKLAGPTGGYIIGFLPMAVIGGAAVERFQKRAVHFLAMVLGTAVCYALGTAWFCAVMNTGVVAALGQAVFPFIPVDLAKIAIAVFIGPTIRARVA